MMPAIFATPRIVVVAIPVVVVVIGRAAILAILAVTPWLVKEFRLMVECVTPVGVIVVSGVGILLLLAAAVTVAASGVIDGLVSAAGVGVGGAAAGIVVSAAIIASEVRMQAGALGPGADNF